MATAVFFASVRQDGTYQLYPSDLVDPDERDVLEEHPGAIPIQAHVDVLGTIKVLTVYQDPIRHGWAWVKISDAFPEKTAPHTV